MSGKRESPSSAERELAEYDAVFDALAHASRRHVLLVLHFRGGEMTAGEIAERFACSWPTTSRHLRVLESAGLVRVEKRGRERVYELDRRRLLGVTRRWLDVFGPVEPVEPEPVDSVEPIEPELVGSIEPAKPVDSAGRTRGRR